MKIPFSPWPKEQVQHYKKKGYWQDKTLNSVIEKQALNNPNKIAIICGGRRFSFLRLKNEINKFSLAIAKQQLNTGDKAVLHLGNCVEFYIAFFALLKCGIAPVVALSTHRETEINQYISQTDAKIYISSNSIWQSKASNVINELIQQYTFLTHIVMVEPLQDMNETVMSFESMLASEGDSYDDLGIADQVAFFQLSGGTTGTPKLIPRTHNDYLYSILASAKICQIDTNTRYLNVLPAAHNFSLSSPGALGVLAVGGTVVLAKDPSPDACFPLIEAEKITLTALVPPLAILWMKSAETTKYNIDSLELLQVGGANFPKEAAKNVTKKLNCQLQQVFGMAEGLVNYTRLDDDIETITATQGCPISEDDEILIVNDNDEPVPSGIKGHLLTRGPYTIRGYYNAPEHNAKSFTPDGFYRTGDIVRQTNNGYLMVEGRHKDQINRGGEKIAAEEIENHLISHIDVLDSALVSMPDEFLGEKSCAFVITKKSVTIPSIQLRKYLKKRGLAEYKIPDHFEFVATFPKTPVGKVSKKQLRQDIASILNQN